MIKFAEVLRSVVALGAAVSAFGSPVISPRLAVSVEVDQGQMLWSELNCGACHAGTAGGRVGPVLGKDGLKLTPQFLRAFLNDPQGHKAGTTMPHAIPAEGKADAVEALVNFLAPGADDAAGTAAESGRIAQGRRLYHSVGCVACHGAEEAWQAVLGMDAKAQVDPELKESIPLGPLANKLTVGELAKFLREPAKFRKSGRMPSSKLTDGEATAIAMYLLRAQTNAPGNDAKLIAGLKYEYFEESFSGEPADWTKFTPITGGIASGFSLQSKRRDQGIGFRFTGLITVPADGKYSFWTTSDDGSRLYIDGKVVVENGGEHGPTEKRGEVELKAGRHDFELTFYNNGAGYELKVEWLVPGSKRKEIPADAFSHLGQPMLPLDAVSFTRDATKAEKGKALFASLGCAACHEHPEVKATPPNAKSFNDMASTGGCLANAVKSGLPDFSLSAEQRAALAKFAAAKQWKAPGVTETMAALNCYACHTRDAKGGPTNARLQYFFTSGEEDLGDEGRVPPHLTKVGQKLRREWTTEVLERGATVRPYMATRMPQFGHEAVGKLPEMFEATDGGETKTELGGTPLEEKFGRKLVGTGGLTCISCHTFAGRKSLGIPAIDLTYMTRRLKKDWFHRYLLDPQSLRPGTRMPSFWPNGEAANKEILEGKTDAQINAIWAYLSRGREADLPPGLVTGKKEIVATTEAVIYRNFIQGGGSRAIGVGYPEKANLAFDANQVRLAEIWQGSFIDAARHSNGRGEGFESPLGDRVYKLPEGPGFAILENAESPWPAATPRSANFKMRGYSLDEKMRPTFRYDFGGVEIEDYPVAIETQVDPYLRRTISLKGANEKLWFRAALTDKIEKQADGSFLVDGKVNFKLSGGEAVVRKNGGKSELVVNVKGAKLVEEIRW